MLGCRENLVEVDWDAEGDEEQSANAGLDPVLWLEGWWGDELRPEGERALCAEDCR